MNPEQDHVLGRRLRAWLGPDPHADPAGNYRVTSLYLDDAYDSALFEKLAGLPKRWKVRVRIYNGRPDVIMLEKKIKVGEAVRKERVEISRALYEALRTGRAGPLRKADHPLLDDVARQMVGRLLRPKVIVDYSREAYVCPRGNVRICLDRRLRSGLTNLDLFRPATYAPVPVDGLTILEVKYDTFLPRPLQDLLQTDSLTRQSASKYVLCRSLVKTHAWEDE